MTLIEWITKCSKDELAEIWVAFNCWNWPASIPVEFKPYWWDAESGRYHPKHNKMERKMGFVGVIMDYCKANISDELRQEKWMKHNAITSRAMTRAG